MVDFLPCFIALQDNHTINWDVKPLRNGLSPVFCTAQVIDRTFKVLCTNCSRETFGNPEEEVPGSLQRVVDTVAITFGRIFPSQISRYM